MAKFTIKDLAEGRCAVKNDGTVEELNKVLKVAFPRAAKAYGNCELYFRYNDGSWTGWNITELPFQSVKDFLEELEKPKLPKRGDRILVWDEYEKCWVKRIFIGYIEGATEPVVCVLARDTDKFNNGKSFGTCTWEKWKPISEKKVLEVTLEDVAKQFKVDEVKIIEKKG